MHQIVLLFSYHDLLVDDEYPVSMHVTTNEDYLFADMTPVAVHIPSPFTAYNRRYILYASSLHRSGLFQSTYSSYPRFLNLVPRISWDVGDYLEKVVLMLFFSLPHEMPCTVYRQLHTLFCPTETPAHASLFQLMPPFLVSTGYSWCMLHSLQHLL